MIDLVARGVAALIVFAGMFVSAGCEAQPAAGQPQAVNVALGRAYTLRPAPSERYPDTSARLLTDGRIGLPGRESPGWVGFDRGQPVFTIDLETVHRLDDIKARFLLDPTFDIRLPNAVTLYVSIDGHDWMAAGSLSSDGSSLFRVSTKIHARFVRLAIQRQAWVFLGEVEIFGAPAPDFRPTNAALPLKKILYLSGATEETDERELRVRNILDGMGVDFRLVRSKDLLNEDMSKYQLVIATGSAAAGGLAIDEAAEHYLIVALENGVNVLWIGPGIWGSFKSTDFPDAFGLRYVEQKWSRDFGAHDAEFASLAGKRSRLRVRDEVVPRVESTGAEVQEWYLGNQGERLDIPFITRYRAHSGSGIATYISLPLLDNWKVEEAPDTFARAEVLVGAITSLMATGMVSKYPVKDAKDAVFLLRLEDYTPGGEYLGHTDVMWLARMQKLLQLTNAHALPLNISIVPVYAYPFVGEYHRWDSDDSSIGILRQQAQIAFDRGGSLIVHGYTHQRGDGFENISAVDSEMWDANASAFLSYEEQKQVTDRAFTEIVRVWRITPTIWETPHYMSNADTYRAASASGFRYFAESDTKLFPNRYGYKNLANGGMLNIPETAFYFPEDADAVKRSTIIKQHDILPRLARLNAVFQVFFHNSSTHQLKALQNLLATAARYDLWKPGMEEYAHFWEQRERATVDADIDPVRRVVSARVSGAPDRLTLAVRLPIGAEPLAVELNGRRIVAKTRRIADAWTVLPVLAAGDNQIEVTYSRPSGGMEN